ncbi:MAG: sarcosine oxidase subunit delta [Pseudomonadota bacterium]
MLILHCPYCGVDADETELTAGGQAHLTRETVGADDDAFEAYLFQRENPKGVHFERWRHTYGCGKWFHAVRCTTTLEVFATYSAQTSEPPKQATARLTKKRPGWSWGTFS